MIISSVLCDWRCESIYFKSVILLLYLKPIAVGLKKVPVGVVSQGGGQTPDSSLSWIALITSFYYNLWAQFDSNL